MPTPGTCARRFAPPRWLWRPPPRSPRGGRSQPDTEGTPDGPTTRAQTSVRRGVVRGHLPDRIPDLVRTSRPQPPAPFARTFAATAGRQLLRAVPRPDHGRDGHLHGRGGLLPAVGGGDVARDAAQGAPSTAAVEHQPP